MTDPLTEQAREIETYELPDGRLVAIWADVARGAKEVSYTLANGEIVFARKVGQCAASADAGTLRQQIENLPATLFASASLEADGVIPAWIKRADVLALLEGQRTP